MDSWSCKGKGVKFAEETLETETETERETERGAERETEIETETETETEIKLGVGKQTLIFRDLGQLDYQAAWDYQESLLLQNVQIKSSNKNLSVAGETVESLPSETTHYLLFVEHPLVYTLGRSGNISNMLLVEDEMKEKGIEFFKTNRGGDITFHGPGQIVGYPILDLERFYTDIGRYLRNIEEVIIRTLAAYGIKGERSSGETGVWIDPNIPGKERKICAIGVRSSRWITMHGFAFNINTDLSFFNHIIPCGINNKQVTSLAKELGHEVSMEEAKKLVLAKFEEVFEVKTEDLKPEDQNSFAR